MQSLFGRFIYLPGTLVNQFLGQFLKFLAKSFCDNSCLYVFQDRRGLILLIWMPNHLGGPFSKEQSIFILNLFLCPESGLLTQVQMFVDKLTGILQKHDVTQKLISAIYSPLDHHHTRQFHIKYF